MILYLFLFLKIIKEHLRKQSLFELKEPNNNVEDRFMIRNTNNYYLTREYHRLCQIVFDYEMKNLKKQNHTKWNGTISEISSIFLKRFCDTFFIPNFAKEIMYDVSLEKSYNYNAVFLIFLIFLESC